MLKVLSSMLQIFLKQFFFNWEQPFVVQKLYSRQCDNTPTLFQIYYFAPYSWEHENKIFHSNGLFPTLFYPMFENSVHTKFQHR